jgi:hypothetical protein
MKLLEVSKLESLLSDLIKCQEEAGVIMTDAKYIHEASMDLDIRIKEIGDRLNKLIQDNLEE